MCVGKEGFCLFTTFRNRELQVTLKLDTAFEFRLKQDLRIILTSTSTDSTSYPPATFTIPHIRAFLPKHGIEAFGS